MLIHVSLFEPFLDKGVALVLTVLTHLLDVLN
jgi:hypothetical protein